MVWINTLLGKFDYKKSTRRDKKLMVVVDGKTIHFGQVGYEQYHDKTGIWKHMDHNDQTRRKRYILRATEIKTGDGELTFRNPKSPNAHAIWVLW